MIRIADCLRSVAIRSLLTNSFLLAPEGSHSTTDEEDREDGRPKKKKKKKDKKTKKEKKEKKSKKSKQKEDPELEPDFFNIPSPVS